MSDQTSKLPPGEDKKVNVGKNVSDSVIVTGNGNVVNVGDGKSTKRRKLDTAVVVALISFAGTIIAALISSPLFEKKAEPISAPAATTAKPFETPTPVPPTETKPPMLTSTPTKVPPVTPKLLPAEIVDDFGVEMMLVSEGEFIMGGEDGNEDQRPVHTVYLDAFYMDKYEVTNALYKVCVNADVCGLPHELGSSTYPDYYSNPEFENYPVIYMDWFQARDYCAWRGARLPTEAQWEKAARGTDGRTYPWGEGIGCNRANYNYCVDEVAEVGSYESGKSPYGIYDMAGNVWEWVSSVYGGYPYSFSDGREDLYLVGSRVIRGGSWDGGDLYARSSFRWRYDPEIVRSSHGFRCARDANK